MKEKILILIEKVTKKTKSELVDGFCEKKTWDSLTHVELIIALEGEFNIFFEDVEIGAMDTPEKVVSLAMEKIGKL